MRDSKGTEEVNGRGHDVPPAGQNKAMQFAGGLMADAIALAFIAVLIGAGVVAWRVRSTNRTLMWALIGLDMVVVAGSLLWTYMLEVP